MMGVFVFRRLNVYNGLVAQIAVSPDLCARPVQRQLQWHRVASCTLQYMYTLFTVIVAGLARGPI